MSITRSSMTDSMNFGPEWLRNLSSEGTTTGSSSGGGIRQLAEYRYSREDMLALFEKNLRPPMSLCQFTPLYSEQVLQPLALQPAGDEERAWAMRTPAIGVSRGRGGSLERGRGSRGRGTYTPFGRNSGGGFETGGGWGNGNEASDWSPRKEFNNHINRSASVDNWRRNRDNDDNDGWRTNNQNRNSNEKWTRSTSWREESSTDERGERGHSWHDNGPRTHMQQRRMWDDDHLPEWATENLSEGGGTFDSSGAFHGDDEENSPDKGGFSSSKKDGPLQKSASQHSIPFKNQPSPLTSSHSATSLLKQPDIDKTNENRKEDENIAAEISRSKNNNNNNSNKVKQSNDQKNVIKEEVSDKRKGPSESLKNNVQQQQQQHQHQQQMKQEMVNSTQPLQQTDNSSLNGNDLGNENRVVDEFERYTEDLVIKLVDESTTKSTAPPEVVNNPLAPLVGVGVGVGVGGGPLQPPPNLSVPPMQEKWFYQDPQNDVQGPFTSAEMTEWLKAGYFLPNLMVKRQCDESFYQLGDLMAATGPNPFQSHNRFPVVKQQQELPKQQDLLQLHFLQQQQQQAQQNQFNNLRQPSEVFTQGVPWAMQHREMLARQIINQNQTMTTPDLHFMDLLNQMGQSESKMQNDKPPNAVPQLNPLQQLVQQMGGMQMHARMPAAPTGLPGNIPLVGQTGPRGLQGVLPHNLPASVIPGSVIPSSVLPMTGLGITGNLQGDTLTNTLSGMHHSGLPAGLVGPTTMSTGIAKSTPLEHLSGDNPLNNLIRQLQQNKAVPPEGLWQQNQAFMQAPPPPQQWPQEQQQQQQQPISMWDLPIPPQVSAAAAPQTHQQQPSQHQMPLTSSKEPTLPQPEINQQQTAVINKEEPVAVKPSKTKNKESAKEEKKRKEMEEKQAKKEAEEKRKQEQRKQEAEKKAAEEKRKKEEERIRKELEKAKKEADEKRMRELEEKRRQKELRKLEEENRKKAEENKKLEDEERERREMKAREEQRHVEEQRRAQENAVKVAKAAPWSNNTNTIGMSLEEIQKAERQRRAEQAALLQQQKQMQQEQQPPEKPNMQLCWANKPVGPRQIKSLAEIQAEEQERLAKQQQEARIAQMQKDKELSAAAAASAPTIWSSGHQNLSWNSAASQWNSGGFWDENTSSQPQRAGQKPSSTQAKTVNVANKQGKQQQQSQQQQQQQQANKAKQQQQAASKREEAASSASNNNKNGPAVDEFMVWCTKTLTNMKTTVDIPTFVSFLRDIESAYDVKEICRDYLGDGMQTNQFATQFLEKRRQYKPKNAAQKDDLCTPAPAITPSNNEFQEVKKKRTKKSKMLKVDARILGFSVTAAQDRINVGDRDYVDTA